MTTLTTHPYPKSGGLSARIFGVNSWSLLVPEALMGVATVAVLYAAVKRWHGPVAGLIAGAGMRSNGGSGAAQEIAAWVTETYQARTVGGVTVYDLTA
jgi:4-amino-4-deoxy-L-arabinose transferase-like glycosyltransferase